MRTALPSPTLFGRMTYRSLGACLVAFLFASGALAQRAADQAATHLQRTAAQYGLVDGDLADLAVTDAYASRSSGTEHVYLQQTSHGLPIVGAEFTVALGRDGEVAHAAGRGVTLADRRLARTPALSASSAAAALAREASLTPTEAFRVLATEGSRAPVVTLSEAGIAEEPVEARLVYYRTDEDALVLAWEVGLYELGAQHYWLGYVDAATGEVLARHDLVVHDTFGVSPAAGTAEPVRLAPVAEAPASAGAPLALAGSYRVYALPEESPLSASPLPPADGRVLVTSPADPSASPFGWHDVDGTPGAEYTVTRGNNVHAYTDRRSNNSPQAGTSANGGAGLVFDFPIDFAQAPETYGEAAVTNLFYTNNVFHDLLWRYGFDEAAGNFQENNYGNGGLGGDYVRAEAQDGADRCRPIPIPIFCLNNANFFTPADGQRPRMQMFEWNETSPRRDGDLDNGIVLHEYGHGVSNRLTGGPSNVSCLTNSEQMGEGWSDYFSVLLTIKPGDTRTVNRGVGNYPLGLAASGPGIREYPYNTDFSVNPQTYGFSRTAAAPHGVGSVWTSILWEATWDMIDAFGFDPNLYTASGTAGNQVMMRLVLAGMKLQPCRPGFVDGRDALLAADELLYDGAHTGVLWAAFARRGLGANADQGSSSSNADNTEDFTVPFGQGVTLALVPQNQPAVVPRGGTVAYTVALSTPSAASFDYWAEATLPDGSTRVVFGPGTATVAAGTFTSSLSQQVPAQAPLGAYAYTMKVGAFPNTVVAQDGFAVTVTAAHRLAGTADTAWRLFDADGRDLADGVELDFQPAVSASGLPVSALQPAYPNPVTDRATIAFDLAESGPVRLTVYDVLGREVAVLADGSREAGRSTVPFDASALLAGVYLVRLSAPGVVQTQRLTVAH